MLRLSNLSFVLLFSIGAIQAANQQHWNNNNNQGGGHVDPQPLRTPKPRRRPAPSQNNGCGGGGYGGGGCGNNLPAPSRPAQNAAAVQTECPAGSKCVAENFCDANGRMSRSRVSLSNWEKEQRGEMISCMTNTNTGSWGICCATQQPSRPANNNYRPPNNNQNRQPVNNAKPLPHDHSHSKAGGQHHSKPDHQSSSNPNAGLNIRPRIKELMLKWLQIESEIDRLNADYDDTKNEYDDLNADYDYLDANVIQDNSARFTQQLRRRTKSASSFQQQPQPQAQASCPNVNNLPPVEACAGRSSNCWSVGQTDVDCPGFALCCFDGCANTCQGGGGTAPRSIRGR